MSDVTFLPWLRRGLVTALTAVDPLTGPLERGPSVTGWIEVEDRRSDQAVRLHGADAVTGLSPGQVIREEPRPDSAEVEPSYFPFVELAAPDLPWLFTPASDDGTGRLRPWLVLVCVREQEGVSIVSQGGGALPVLRIDAPAVPADELPDLDDSWAWTHVQSLVGTDVDAAVAGDTGEVVARVMCPRRTVADAAWLACLVPAFVRPEAEAQELVPAWARDVAAPFESPVYHHWRFTTGAAGTFETLCRRLKPDGEGADLGRYPMEIGDPGIVTPATESVLVDMEGTLETPGATSRPWPGDHRSAFQDELTGLLDAGVARVDWTPPKPGKAYDPNTQDPVVAPPLYGAWPAGLVAVPAAGWARMLNLHPVRRAAAGLGALVVRANQEALVAGAWDQAGDLRATVTALNCGRLAVEVSRGVARKVVALDDAGVLQVTARLHAFIPDGAATVRSRLLTSAAPNGLVSSAYLRQTRQATPLARDWRRRTASAIARLGADHVATTLLATQPGGDTVAIEFAAAGVPAGAQVRDPTLDVLTEPEGFVTADPALLATIAKQVLVASRPPMAARTAAIDPPIIIAVPSRPADDVSHIAGTVRARIDPLPSVRANLTMRIPALDPLIPSDGVPTTLALGPVFEDPLSVDLIALGSSWLLPGVEAIARNRVRLVAENLGGIGAFMLGANHEMARELLWRGYPVDMRATFFHRFWSYVDAAQTDVGELTDWGRPRGAPSIGKTLEQNMGAADATATVIVVRGDIVRRYPTAHYYLQQASWADGAATPVDGAVVAASFLGSLDRDTVFFGFEVDPQTVVGDRSPAAPGYFLAIEEQLGAPRFGLDDPKPEHFAKTPKSWDRLSWAHLVDDRDELDALTHAPAEHDRLAAVTDTAATWGTNSAHNARACWQRPFRMLIHASDLI